MLQPITPSEPSPPRPLHVVHPGEETLCANPTCRNLVTDEWDENGRYCARCAIELDLFDRETRRERCFPVA